MPLLETDTLDSVSDLSGLEVSPLTMTYVDGTPMLLAGGRFNDSGVARIDLAGTGALAVLDVSGTNTIREDGLAITAAGIGAVEIGGSTYVYFAGTWQDPADYTRGYLVYELGADGSLRAVEREEATVSTAGDDPQFVTAGGNTYLVNMHMMLNLTSYAVNGDGSLDIVDNIQVQDRANSSWLFDATEIGNRAFVVTEGGYAEGPLQTFRVLADGTLQNSFTLDRHDPGLDNLVTSDVEIGQVGNKTFVFVPETTTGSIAVYRLDRQGRLTHVESERPDIHDTWDYPQTVEFFSFGGKDYLGVGGQSVAVFEVSKNGALTEVEAAPFADVVGRAYDMQEAVVGNQQYLYVSTVGDPAVHSFRFEQGDAGTFGGKGSNKIRGTGDDDRIYARGGDDTVLARAGNDLVEGGAGNDVIRGHGGKDNLFGEAGRDRIYGGDDEDWVWGGGHRDRLFGGDSRDYLHGGGGADLLDGGNGNDYLFGGGGNDRLLGKGDKDVLTDGGGSDRLRGGADADQFVFVLDGQTDRILDYEDGLDQIDVSAWSPTISFPDLVITQKGDFVKIAFDDEVLLVKNSALDLVATDLSLADFILT